VKISRRGIASVSLIKNADALSGGTALRTPGKQADERLWTGSLCRELAIPGIPRRATSNARRVLVVQFHRIFDLTAAGGRGRARDPLAPTDPRILFPRGYFYRAAAVLAQPRVLICLNFTFRPFLYAFSSITALDDLPGNPDSAIIRDRRAS